MRRILNNYKKLLKINALLFLIVSFSFNARSQSFTLFDIDASGFPFFKAKFIAIDKNANQVIDIKPEEVSILEGSSPAEVVSVINPVIEPPASVSVVIAIDVSSSMNGTNLDNAKELAKKLVNLLALEISECAIVSFDNKNYLNCDFTKNPDKLISSINSMSAKGGTSFDAALTGKPFGAFLTSKNSSNKRVVIIITDGQSNGDEKNILDMAKENNISLYSVGVGSYLPDVLKNVPLKTEGLFYEKLSTDAEIENIATSIMVRTQKLKYSEITWKSNDFCSKFRTIYLKTRQFTATAEATVSDMKILTLTATPSSLAFGKVPPGQSKDLVLTLKAPGNTIEITGLSFNNENFKIKDMPVLPLKLEPKVEKKIVISYTAKDSLKTFAHLIIKTSICHDKSISLSSNFQDSKNNPDITNLFVKSPNGLEVFVAGTDTIISWGGINNSLQVLLDYSTDNGKIWNPVDTAKGGSYKWKVPNFVSNKYLVRAKVMTVFGGLKLNNFYSMDILANSVAVSPNGTTLAAGSSDINFFNAKTGIFLFSLKSYKGKVLSVDFSNDGKRIAASTAGESAARIYDVATGQCLVTIQREHFKDVNSIRFNPKSDKIVTASTDKTVRVWGTVKGNVLCKFNGHSDKVNSANFSPDGNKVVSSSDDKTLKVWNVNTGSILYTISEKKCRFNDACFSPDGLQILSACSDSLIRIWDVASGNLNMILKGHTDEVKSAIYSKDGSKIISVSDDHTMKFWDAYTGTLLYTIDAHNEPITSVCISDDGSRIYTAGLDAVIKIWLLTSSKAMDEDCSDNVFSVISPKPKSKDVSFDKQLIGTVTDKTISDFISNPSKYKIRIDKIEIIGKNAADYRILSKLPPYDIEPLDKKSVEFSFTPSVEGNRNAIILIYTPTDTLKQSITGVGIKKQIEVIATEIDFGKVLVNKSRDTTAILLINAGNAPVVITKIENAGPDSKQFIILDAISSFTLNAGEKKSLKIRFAPVTRGKTNGSINFYIKDINGLSSVNLLGEGDAPKTMKLFGKIYDNKTKKPLIADVICYDILSNREMKKLKSDAAGNYLFTISVDRNYSLIVQKDSFLTASENVDLSALIINDMIEKDVYLSKIEVGSLVRLNNIFFDFAKASLKTESFPDLDRIVKLLKEYPNIQLEIDGHTDYVGSDADNMVLSENRAKSCLEYIVSKGINKERLTFKGFGESKPVADNKTEEGRKLNRRVEFIILKK
jgi:WD40 repeat protein/outer membrane protein OmpA-like peptidoglycan-associated protein